MDAMQGLRASVIASGASLKGFDLETIGGYRIGINHVYKYVDCDAIVCYDSPEIIGIPKELEHKTHTLIGYNFGTMYDNGSPHGFDRRDGYVVQINASLFMAINVAIHKGFKDIDVYGADMALTDGYIHFYDDKKADERLTKHYERRFKKNKLEWEMLEKKLLADESVTFIDVRKSE